MRIYKKSEVKENESGMSRMNLSGKLGAWRTIK